MKKVVLWSHILLATLLYGVEVRVGKTDFHWKMGIVNFFSADFTLDVATLSLANRHDNFGSSRFYYFYDFELYRSDYMDKMTTLASYPLTFQWPVVGSFNDLAARFIPVPADYKVRGIDCDLGIGYDLYNDGANYVGVGVSSGFSMPYMKMRNLKKSIEITYALLQATKTEILTYKLGVALTGKYALTPSFSLYADATTAYQTGKVENDWLRSSVDVDGEFTMVDMGVLYQYNRNWSLLLGYTHKEWDVNSVKVDMLEGMFKAKMSGLMDIGFDEDTLYVGVSYSF